MGDPLRPVTDNATVSFIPSIVYILAVECTDQVPYSMSFLMLHEWAKM